MRNLYGLVCLLLGAGLVIAQIVASIIEAKRGGQVAAAAKVVNDAAKKTEKAAATTRAAIGAVPAAAEVRSLFGDQYVHMARDAQRLNEADAKAEEAQDEAKEAKEQTEEAGGAGRWDFLGSLAGKAPLAVSGAVLIALGAIIMGFIDLAVAASV